MTAALTARAAARPVESSSASVSLMHLSRREWRAHPWRYAVIVLALALGVALAWSVLFVVLGVVGITDFYLWEYDYGHNLDQHAAIIIPGMS